MRQETTRGAENRISGAWGEKVAILDLLGLTEGPN